MPGKLMLVGCMKPQFLAMDLSIGLLEFPYNITVDSPRTGNPREREGRQR